MAGRKLPGERELAQRLAISRQRLRSLLDHLEVEGVVQRLQGSGTYAVDAHDKDLVHVGVLIDAHLKLGNDPFFSLVVERLQLTLQAAGIHCVVERITGDGRPRFIGDGAITLGLAGLGALHRLTAADPPAVSLFAEERDEPPAFSGRVSMLLIEDRGAGIAAAQRAIREGCRRLIFLGRSDLSAPRARWDGVRHVAESAGVALERHECSMNYQAGRTAADVLTRRFTGTPTDDVGLIAANDWLAVGLRIGLSDVGSELRSRPLYSFDGLPITADPSLEIHSLRPPLGLIVDDALAELRRLARHRTGRMIRYALEWGEEE